MTKEQEIKMIDEIIRDHCHDSYLGMWLRNNHNRIIACIKNDLPLDLVRET